MWVGDIKNFVARPGSFGGYGACRVAVSTRLGNLLALIVHGAERLFGS